MNVGEIRIATERDFEVLKRSLYENDGWSIEYEDMPTTVWTRIPPQEDTNFKMIKVIITDKLIQSKRFSKT